MEKRTNIDFSGHEITTSKSENATIYDLHLPEKGSYHRIRYINSCGILAVNGDFGNWIFCREFHPGPKGGVSDSYWAEKLQIASEQRAKKFSQEETEKEIKRLLNEEEDLSEEEIEYLKGCLHNVDDMEVSYKHFAYTESCGRFGDGEYVPYEEDYHFWLKGVFDGFDEMCSRMK